MLRRNVHVCCAQSNYQIAGFKPGEPPLVRSIFARNLNERHTRAATVQRTGRVTCHVTHYLGTSGHAVPGKKRTLCMSGKTYEH